MKLPFFSTKKFDAAEFLRRYDEMDRRLVAAGFHPTSPWWRALFGRFFTSSRRERGALRRLVVRAGRRSGKSSTLCRLSVAWALWGPWSVPAGDIGVVAFVSVSRDESAGRLRTIAAILRALGVKFEPRGDEIEISARPALFKTFSCTTDSVGFTAILIVGDEVARWESRDSSANPAREVFGSIMPTLATQPEGFAVMSSAPWGTDDFHHECFDLGDTDYQVTAFAPSWVANPTLTEEATHALEPDARTWSREYAAEPGVMVSRAFDAADVAAAFALDPTESQGRGFLAIDASSLRGDSFAYIAGFETSYGLVVSEVSGWEDEQMRAMTLDTIAEALAVRAKAWGTRTIFGDHHEQGGLTSLLAQRHVQLVPYFWSEASKDSAVILLRRLMRERRLSLPEHARLRREMLGLKMSLMPSGKVKYQTNGQDFVSALVTLAHAAVDGKVVAAGARPRVRAPACTVIDQWNDEMDLDRLYDTSNGGEFHPQFGYRDDGATADALGAYANAYAGTATRK